MVAGEAMVKQGDIKFLHGLPEFHPVGIAIPGKLQEELPIMATVGQVINPSCDEIPIRPWHCASVSNRRCQGYSQIMTRIIECKAYRDR
jgi:hypothetical protein